MGFSGQRAFVLVAAVVGFPHPFLEFAFVAGPPPYTPSMPITRLDRDIHAQPSALEHEGVL